MVAITAHSRQVLIVGVGSLAAATPYLAVILTAIIGAWLLAARSLATQFDAKMTEAENDSRANAL